MLKTFRRVALIAVVIVICAVVVASIIVVEKFAPCGLQVRAQKDLGK